MSSTVASTQQSSLCSLFMGMASEVFAECEQKNIVFPEREICLFRSFLNRQSQVCPDLDETMSEIRSCFEALDHSHSEFVKLIAENKCIRSDDYRTLRRRSGELSSSLLTSTIDSDLHSAMFDVLREIDDHFFKKQGELARAEEEELYAKMRAAAEEKAAAEEAKAAKISSLEATVASQAQQMQQMLQMQQQMQQTMLQMQQQMQQQQQQMQEQALKIKKLETNHFLAALESKRPKSA